MGHDAQKLIFHPVCSCHAVVELGVVNSDGCLVRQGVKELDLLLAEFMLHFGVDAQNSHAMSFSDQRNSQKRHQTTLTINLLIESLRICLNISDDKRCLGLANYFCPSAGRSFFVYSPFCFVKIPTNQGLHFAALAV